MRIAIVYDWIDKWGGVERLLPTLHEMFPDADWYTSYVDTKVAPWAQNLSFTTSFIQRLPSFIRKNRIVSLLFYPYAFESFDFSDYELVISISSSFAKGIITKPSTRHICYLLTPTRYLWGMSEDYISGWKKFISAPIMQKLRKWDYIASQRPDTFITLSTFVSKRIKKYYLRNAEVIYPPFDEEYWKIMKNEQAKPSTLSLEGDYYLCVSRLEPYKKIDLLIKTFNKRKDTLLIVGRGSQKSKLKKFAHQNIQFIEDISDKELSWLYNHAKAFIMPQEEEFGYVALEAQYFGCPIIYYSDSGASEIVSKLDTHISFSTQSKISLQEALERFEAVAYNVERRKNVQEAHFEKFSKMLFIKNFKAVIQANTI